MLGGRETYVVRGFVFVVSSLLVLLLLLPPPLMVARAPRGRLQRFSGAL